MNILLDIRSLLSVLVEYQGFLFFVILPVFLLALLCRWVYHTFFF